MAKIDVFNQEAKAVKSIELSDAVFGIEPNQQAMYDAILVYQAGLRQGTHATLTRAEVSGTGKKPFRQKGTGRARQGSIRAGQWTGGGVIFGPTPRSHARRINNKMVKLAMRSVLSGKVADSELVLVDSLEFAQPSTKQAKAALQNLGIEGKRVTVIVPDDDVNTYLSFRNLPKVSIFGVSEVTTRFLIDNGALVMSADVAKQLGEVLA